MRDEQTAKGRGYDPTTILVCSALIFLAGLAVFVWKMTGESLAREINNYVATTADYADQRMSSLYYEINNMPSGAGNDLLFLSKMYTLSERSDEAEGHGAGGYMSRSFSEFMNQNPAYSDIKIIDKNGAEIYSMRRTGEGNTYDTAVTTTASAFDKDFFKTISLLDDGQVYISNFEAGSYGGASVWTMRYATPIYDEPSECDEIIVLTVNVEYFLDDIRNFSRPGEQVFLINSDGFYLANSDRGKESLQSGAAYNFRVDFPDVADKILSDTEERKVETADKLFTFRRIRPTLSSFVIYEGTKDAGLKSDANDRFYWILVSVSDRADSATIIANLKSRHNFLLGITGSLILLIALSIFAMRRLSAHKRK